MLDLTLLYDYARGPAAWLCVSLFLAGTIFQVVRFYRLSRTVRPERIAPTLSLQGKAEAADTRRKWVARLARLRVSLMGMDPIMAFVTVTFHASIFLLPLFVLEHATLYLVNFDLNIWPVVLPHNAADILMLYILACALFFLARRLLVARVRAISTTYDYAILLLTLVPFLTGFLAIHRIGDYRMLITAHILSVELLLVVMPFTKFSHMIFFFINRFAVVQENSFAVARRKW